MTRLCQRIFPFIFLITQLVSCSGSKDIVATEETLVVTERVQAKPWWFDGPEHITPRDQLLRAPVHSFFDFVPFSKISDREINVVPTTVRGSKFSYKLDTYSGKLFRSHDYCPQNDVWKKYSSTIFEPPYTEAIVPRLLDQIGFPQKVIVFGEKKYFLDYSTEAVKSYRVRVIGGVIEQYCKVYPCDINEKWLNRMVLVAVNIDDMNLNEVLTIEELKKKVNWEEALAFMQNGEGRSKAKEQSMPSYRVIGEIGAKKAMLYSLTKGHLFTFDELQGLRNSCWKLYDYAWKASEFIRSGEQRSKDDIILELKNEEREKIVELFDKRVVNVEEDEVRDVNERIQLELASSNFARFFTQFHQKYGKSFNLCRRFVSHSNIKHNMERHWFFTYLSLFFEIEQNEYVYKCNKRGWVKNIRKPNGKLTVNQSEELKQCSVEDLDDAFDTALVLMNTMRKSIAYPYVEYIEYDNNLGGSHQLLNSLAFFQGKKLACLNPDQERGFVRDIFPRDIEWKRFSKDKFMSNLLKIK